MRRHSVVGYRASTNATVPVSPVKGSRTQQPCILSEIQRMPTAGALEKLPVPLPRQTFEFELPQLSHAPTAGKARSNIRQSHQARLGGRHSNYKRRNSLPAYMGGSLHDNLSKKGTQGALDLVL